MFDVNALGQIVDTSWGRSSTSSVATYSVKFKLNGDRLVASYAAIVNFASNRQMIETKRLYDEESIACTAEAVKMIKAKYKKLTGKTLTLNEVETSDSIEIIGLAVHNPKKTAYYRRSTVFDIV